MRGEIIKFISNINISYVTLSFLFLVVSLLFLSKYKIINFIKQLYIIVYVIVSWIGFYYLNDIFNGIFTFKFLSIKLYLILLIVGNIIMLMTINFKVNKSYKILNYGIFIINILIFIINIGIMVGNRYSSFVIANNTDISNLINLNFIIFIIYLNLLCLNYIIHWLSKIFKTKKLVVNNEKDKELQVIKKEEIKIPKISRKRPIYKKNDEEGFYIDGVDCSIIFESDDKETIIKNYYILLHDINAKLINGYTLKENIRLKKIINKLNIKDLNNIDLDINKLSNITIDEYNLLKRYLNTRNSNL